MIDTHQMHELSIEMNEEAPRILERLRVYYIPSLYIVRILRRIIMIIDSSLLKKVICWKLKILDNIKTNDIQLFNYMLLIWLYHLLAVMMVSLFNWKFLVCVQLSIDHILAIHQLIEGIHNGNPKEAIIDYFNRNDTQLSVTCTYLLITHSCPLVSLLDDKNFPLFFNSSNFTHIPRLIITGMISFLLLSIVR